MQSARARWPSHDELSTLVRAAHDGGPRAIDRVLEAVRPSLRSFFARPFPTVVAEEFAQSALIRVARAAGRIEPERADRYLMTLARNILRTE